VSGLLDGVPVSGLADGEPLSAPADDEAPLAPADCEPLLAPADPEPPSALAEPSPLAGPEPLSALADCEPPSAPPDREPLPEPEGTAVGAFAVVVDASSPPGNGVAALASVGVGASGVGVPPTVPKIGATVPSSFLSGGRGWPAAAAAIAALSCLANRWAAYLW
jgi:hypothetical protein